IDDGTEPVENDPYINIRVDSVDRIKDWRSSNCTLTIGNDVKKGNKFDIWFWSYKEKKPNKGATKEQWFTVEATLYDTAEKIANAFANQFRNSDLFNPDFAGGGDVGGVSVDPVTGNASLNFRISNHANWSYWEPNSHVNP